MRAFFVTPLVIFLLVLIMMVAKLLDTGKQEPSALLNKPLPVFNLPAALDNVDGLKTSDLKGKYSILNIFASWCITCKIEHPFLLSLQKEGVAVYGIAWKDKKENLAKWINEKGNPYKAIGADYDGKTIIELGVTGAPESFVISPEGIVLYKYSGILTQDVWDKKILPLMGNK